MKAKIEGGEGRGERGEGVRRVPLDSPNEKINVRPRARAPAPHK
jgi:hypothetical protein